MSFWKCTKCVPLAKPPPPPRGGGGVGGRGIIGISRENHSLLSISYLLPQRVRFLRHIGPKTVGRYRLCPNWSGIECGSVERYLSFEFKMSKKERLIGEFEMNFKKSIFQWPSTLIIKDAIISAYVNTRPGLKTGIDFRGQGRRAVQSFLLFFLILWRLPRVTVK